MPATWLIGSLLVTDGMDAGWLVGCLTASWLDGRLADNMHSMYGWHGWPDGLLDGRMAG